MNSSRIDAGKEEKRLSGAGPGVLAVVCFAQFFGVLNASAVTVALPAIGEDLSVEPGVVGWLMTGFLLVYGVAIPFYGRLADSFGARRLFLLGVSLFSVGSLLCAFAPTFPLLLGARLVQAIGGAAVPGLGMALASRAYPVENRGMVLGIIGMTIGVGAGVGPLLGGVLSDAFGWQAVFAVTAISALAVPVGFMVLPVDEKQPGEKLDVLGGLLLAVTIGGALIAVTEVARSGWQEPLVIGGLFSAAGGAVALVVRQQMAKFPFIPMEFVQNTQLLALGGMSFAVMAAYVAALVGLPLLLTELHNQTPIEIGLTLLPGAILTGVLGLAAGRVVDRIGIIVPMRIGLPLMLLGLLCMSTFADAPALAISGFMALLGGGFALVNTPIAAAVSLVVRPQRLASALSMNSMLFFIGGSFGAALVIALSIGGGDASAINPLHTGAAAGYSNAFMSAGLFVLAAVGLSFAVPSQAGEPAKEELTSEQLGPLGVEWVADCSVPWTPECSRLEHAEVSIAS
jgi:EmrB/QacA subfamily drug resistance transporter